jgi:hypothetical protein
VAIWLEEQLRALGFIWRNNGEPTVLAKGYVGLRQETQYFRIELQRLVLVIHEHARYIDPHSASPPSSTGHRSEMLFAPGIVLMTTEFHFRADERLNAVETGIWAGIAAAVAIGRWDLVSSGADGSPWILVVALGLLVPAAIINVIVLRKRSVQSDSPDDNRGDAKGLRNQFQMNDELEQVGAAT